MDPSTVISSKGGDFEDKEAFTRARKLAKTSPVQMKHSTTSITTSSPASENGSDDDDVDTETIRAIERRFSMYGSDSLIKNLKSISNKSELVGNTGLEHETTNTFSIRNTFSEALGKYFTKFESSTFPWITTGFPNLELINIFIDAIKKNRSCQKFIRSKMTAMGARLEKNKKLKGHIKILKDFQFSCKTRTEQCSSGKIDAKAQLVSVRKFTRIHNSKVDDKKHPALFYGPVENSHVANYRMVLMKNPVLLHRPKWSKEDKENLYKGIVQQFQEMVFQRSVELYSGSDKSSEDSVAFEKTVLSISDVETTPENIRSFLPKVDWQRLASIYVYSRSGAECEMRWLNNEDPLLNHNEWTNVEDKKLLSVLQNTGIHNWFQIAATLGTNRTAFQCLARYQRSLNSQVMKSEWTAEDDVQLCEAIEACGEHDWQQVASMLERRTGAQCSNRWQKTLNPARERVGRWTVEEDQHLKVAVMLFGPKTWQKIAQFVSGRTQVQCRERWLNVLDPSLNLREWTEEEDSKLKAAIAEHGHSWTKVAASLAPRTDNQCRRRWKLLLPHEVLLLQAARRIKKSSIISNFVGREEERPALAPSDFLPLAGTVAVSEAENGNTAEEKNKTSRGKPEPKKQREKSSPKIKLDGSKKKQTRKLQSKRKKWTEPADVVESRNGGRRDHPDDVNDASSSLIQDCEASTRSFLMSTDAAFRGSELPDIQRHELMEVDGIKFDTQFGSVSVSQTLRSSHLPLLGHHKEEETVNTGLSMAAHCSIDYLFPCPESIEEEPSDC